MGAGHNRQSQTPTLRGYARLSLLECFLGGRNGTCRGDTLVSPRQIKIRKRGGFSTLSFYLILSMDTKFIKIAVKASIAQIVVNFIITFISSSISYGCCKLLTHGAQVDISRLLLLHESIITFFYMTLITIEHVNAYTKEKDKYPSQKIIVGSWLVHATVSAAILIAAILYAYYY